MQFSYDIWSCLLTMLSRSVRKQDASQGTLAEEPGLSPSRDVTVLGGEPVHRQGAPLDVVSMEAGVSPLHGAGGGLPLTLKAQRDVTCALVAGQQGQDLLNIGCGPGTVLVLRGVGAAEAQHLSLSCRVCVTALLLPDMGELLSKGRSPLDVHIGVGDRVSVPISFDHSAEMVRLLCEQWH